MWNGDGSRGACGCGGNGAGVAPAAGALALTDGPPLLQSALDACWQALERLRGTVSSADNPAAASRALAARETGVDVDANPYHGLTRQKLEAVIRAAYHARAMPEVLLAKWAKEGSAAMTLGATAVPQATTEANARTLLRSSIYYRQLGVDWLTVTTRPDPQRDNVLDESDAGAPAQERHFAARVRQLVQERVLSEDITAAVNAELRVARAAGGLTVEPTVPFYALSLLLVDAVFSRFLNMRFAELPSISEELGYMLWNMGEGSFQTFLRSADRHRREPQHLVGGQPIGIEPWALHTRPRSNEYAQARRNAIRFAHYIRSYRPVFRGALNLIKPGIEDLQAVHARMGAALAVEDPFGLGPVGTSAPAAANDGAVALQRHAIDAPAWGAEGAYAGAASVLGGGRGRFRHAPLDGNRGSGDNVEIRWNLERVPADNVVDVVVHLHGYGDRRPDFLLRKAAAAGVELVDASGRPRRAARPTIALVPRGRHDGGARWVFDRLSGTSELAALTRAALDWLATTHLGAGAGVLQPGRLALHAHSGGGAGLSELLRSGVDPDEVVCFDSTYGGEDPIIRWARARLSTTGAAASGLRVLYLPCSGPQPSHPSGTWTWNARARRWVFGGTGSWSYRGGRWRLVGTEVSARRIHEALQTALSAHPPNAALRRRFRVERTTVAHNDIPATYAPALLDDIAGDLGALGLRSGQTTSIHAPPPASARPGCVANADWLTAAPVKPGGVAAPPPEPAAPPAQAQGVHAVEASAHPARVLEQMRAVPITPSEGRSPTWRETAFTSRAAAGPSFVTLEGLGLARPDGADGFRMRVRGRLVVPRDLASRTAPVPVIAICMGNHQAFDTSAAPPREIESFAGYDYLQQAFAGAGYASISVDTNPANQLNAGIRMRADLILETLALLQDTAAGDAELRGKLDLQKLALVGHSRGGEAVVLAAKLNAFAPWRSAAWAGRAPLRVRAVASIAPTDFSRNKAATERKIVPSVGHAGILQPTPRAPFALAPAEAERFLVLYGSHDGDVTGDGEPPFFDPADRAGTGFSLYDRSTCDRTMAFARGITHNRFNTVWRECADYADAMHAFANPADCTVRRPGARFDPFIFSAEAHRNLAVFYIGALLDRILRGDASKEAILRGERAINRDHAVAIQFALASQIGVSDFEAAAGVTLAGGSLRRAADIPHCPHHTQVFEGAAGHRVAVDVPAAGRDLTARTALTLRVGARYPLDDVARIQRSPTPKFTVRLVTGGGTGQATQDSVSRTGVLTPDRPYFHKAFMLVRTPAGLAARLANVSKLHLDTVVIPLASFAAVDRARPVDLRDVRRVELEVGSGGTEPVLLDSVAFV